MARDPDDSIGNATRAHSIFLRLVLPPYTIHFKSPTYMRDATLDLLDKKVCKQVLKTTAERSDVREAIGTDRKFWDDLAILLRAAIPSLERRSFAVWDPSSVDYESTSGALIAAHYPNLFKDLERLNDLVSISRNVLTTGPRVQDLASECAVDAEVFRLVNACVRVTARGFDGDAGTGEEEKWQWVVNAYKKLLITSLQFLNNLVAQNERRKLMLWVALFDHSSENILPQTDLLGEEDVGPPPEKPYSEHDVLICYGENTVGEKLDVEAGIGRNPFYEEEDKDDNYHQLPPDQVKVEPHPPEYHQGKALLQSGKDFGNGYMWFCKTNERLCKQDWQGVYGRPPTDEEVFWDNPRRWVEVGSAQDVWQMEYEKAMKEYESKLRHWENKKRAKEEHELLDKSGGATYMEERTTPAGVVTQTKHVAARIAQLETQLAERHAKIAPLPLPSYDADGAIVFPNGQGVERASGQSEDYKMLFTAEAGAKILESGKGELMKRLDGSVVDEKGRPRVASPVLSPSSPTYEDGERTVDEGEELEESEEEESEEDEEYPGSTEDGRGLLTDVPLILGPSEIEVLPMIVMSGIVPPANTLAQCKNEEERNALINMHTVRCHLLLAQDNGRNLLRELLIFVAAWDLREEELYFKFMVKIMEAILNNGLMPYAYHAFRDKSRSKDIISPAQAVIMKLLTNIFRARAEASKTAAATNNSQALTTRKPAQSPSSSSPQYPLRVDVHIVNFIFTEFRQHIIPQTCALIFLQGKIHAGLASPEDFPLNLWDMERMYEGVYQYLEFFAVLTEEGCWKGVMAEWEVASELVTLLKELEGGIPKMDGLQAQQMMRRPGNAQRAASADARAGSVPPSAAPVAVERPFDVDPPDPTLPPLPLPVPATTTPNQIFEAETPLAYPEDAQDEPSDFEWRNLKKLTVLVLSSLIWKNKKVQDQVRNYDGLEALLGCCRHDDHNPYIREHAIMCLRFAVEGNEENHAVIERLARHKREIAASAPASEESVPREVLDTNGYETFMDAKGQVGLRRKGGGAGDVERAAGAAENGGRASVLGKPRVASKMTAEKAAELMQNALRDLPLGDKGVSDREKRETLAKLDRAFEGTEKVLGRGAKGR